MTSQKYRITYRLRHTRDVESEIVSGYDALVTTVARLLNTERVSFVDIQKEHVQ